ADGPLLAGRPSAISRSSSSGAKVSYAPRAPPPESTSATLMRCARASYRTLCSTRCSGDGDARRRADVAGVIARLDRELACGRGEFDFGAEGAPAGDRRSEAQVDPFSVDPRQVGGRRAARPIVARRLEREAEFPSAEGRQDHFFGRVGRGAV